MSGVAAEPAAVAAVSAVARVEAVIAGASSAAPSAGGDEHGDDPADDAVEAFGIAGTPQHCTKRLRDFIDAGLDEPVLGLLGSPENCLLALSVMREFRE